MIPKITTQQRVNLIKLMLSVTRSIKGIKLWMKQYLAVNGSLKMGYKAREFIAAETFECGTTCCTLGHGAVAGIGDFPKHIYDPWGVYSYSSFGLNEFTPDWNFVFGVDWPSVRSQAAARIQYYLLGGDISGFSYNDQCEDIDRPYWRAELKELEQELKEAAALTAA